MTLKNTKFDQWVILLPTPVIKQLLRRYFNSERLLLNPDFNWSTFSQRVKSQWGVKKEKEKEKFLTGEKINYTYVKERRNERKKNKIEKEKKNKASPKFRFSVTDEEREKKRIEGEAGTPLEDSNDETSIVLQSLHRATDVRATHFRKWFIFYYSLFPLWVVKCRSGAYPLDETSSWLHTRMERWRRGKRGRRGRKKRWASLPPFLHAPIRRAFISKWFYRIAKKKGRRRISVGGRGEIMGRDDIKRMNFNPWNNHSKLILVMNGMGWRVETAY